MLPPVFTDSLMGEGKKFWTGYMIEVLNKTQLNFTRLKMSRKQ